MMLFPPLQLLEKQAIPVSPPPPLVLIFQLPEVAPDPVPGPSLSGHGLHPQRVKMTAVPLLLLGTVHAFVLFGLYFVWVVFVLFCDAVKTNHICFACALNRSQGLSQVLG